MESIHGDGALLLNIIHHDGNHEHGEEDEYEDDEADEDTNSFSVVGDDSLTDMEISDNDDQEKEKQLDESTPLENTTKSPERGFLEELASKLGRILIFEPPARDLHDKKNICCLRIPSLHPIFIGGIQPYDAQSRSDVYDRIVQRSCEQAILKRLCTLKILPNDLWKQCQESPTIFTKPLVLATLGIIEYIYRLLDQGHMILFRDGEDWRTHIDNSYMDKTWTELSLLVSSAADSYWKNILQKHGFVMPSFNGQTSVEQFSEKNPKIKLVQVTDEEFNKIYTVSTFKNHFLIPSGYKGYKTNINFDSTNELIETKEDLRNATRRWAVLFVEALAEKMGSRVIRNKSIYSIRNRGKSFSIYVPPLSRIIFPAFYKYHSCPSDVMKERRLNAEERLYGESCIMLVEDLYTIKMLPKGLWKAFKPPSENLVKPLVLSILPLIKLYHHFLTHQSATYSTLCDTTEDDDRWAVHFGAPLLKSLLVKFRVAFAINAVKYWQQLEFILIPQGSFAKTTLCEKELRRVSVAEFDQIWNQTFIASGVIICPLHKFSTIQLPEKIGASFETCGLGAGALKRLNKAQASARKAKRKLRKAGIVNTEEMLPSHSGHYGMVVNGQTGQLEPTSYTQFGYPPEDTYMQMGYSSSTPRSGNLRSSFPVGDIDPYAAPVSSSMNASSTFPSNAYYNNYGGYPYGSLNYTSSSPLDGSHSASPALMPGSKYPSNVYFQYEQRLEKDKSRETGRDRKHSEREREKNRVMERHRSRSRSRNRAKRSDMHDSSRHRERERGGVKKNDRSTIHPNPKIDPKLAAMAALEEYEANMKRVGREAEIRKRVEEEERARLHQAEVERQIALERQKEEQMHEEAKRREDQRILEEMIRREEHHATELQLEMERKKREEDEQERLRLIRQKEEHMRMEMEQRRKDEERRLKELEMRRFEEARRIQQLEHIRLKEEERVREMERRRLEEEQKIRRIQIEQENIRRREERDRIEARDRRTVRDVAPRAAQGPGHRLTIEEMRMREEQHHLLELERERDLALELERRAFRDDGGRGRKVLLRSDPEPLPNYRQEMEEQQRLMELERERAFAMERERRDFRDDGGRGGRRALLGSEPLSEHRHEGHPSISQEMNPVEMELRMKMAALEARQRQLVEMEKALEESARHSDARPPRRDDGRDNRRFDRRPQEHNRFEERDTKRPRR